MTRWLDRALVAGAAVIAIAACVDLGGPGSGLGSISSPRFGLPSVVLGDILRDSLGNPAPLTAKVFDKSGNEVTDVPLTFITLDTTISIDADGTVHGLFRDTVGARIVIGAGTLQTTPQKLFVSVAPTTVTPSTAETAIQFVFPSDTSNASNRATLDLTVTGAGGLGAQGFIVQYEITRAPAPLNAATPTAYIANDLNRPSPRDTTDFKGAVSRRVVLRQYAIGSAGLLAGTVTDTIIVRATVKYLGADVAGSPFDFIVPVSKKP